MSIRTKKVKGVEYLYFKYYDPSTQKRESKYCGPVSNPESHNIAEQLYREFLESRMTQIDQERKEIEKELKRVYLIKDKGPDTISALDLVHNTPMHDPQIYFKSSENMAEVGDNSVQLVVTSPPYNVGKNYVKYDDKKELNEYLDFLDRVWMECRRVLSVGGRIAINVADTWRQPYVPLHSHIALRMLNLGFKMRGIVYWNKGASVGVSTAWGSWRSPSNPTIRDVGEYILIFSKDSFKLESPSKTVTMTSKEFTDYTKSVWTFPTSNGKKNGHPAPFPEELPRRLIKFYTYLGDTVLDPFLGSGTTCKVAKAWGRKSIGYEVDKSYKSEIQKKIATVETLAIQINDLLPNDKGTTLDAVMPKENNSQ